jgi:hypothetical protein
MNKPAIAQMLSQLPSVFETAIDFLFPVEAEWTLLASGLDPESVRLILDGRQLSQAPEAFRGFRSPPGRF